MNDQQRLLADSANALFASLGPSIGFAEGWPQIEQMGLPLLLVPEADGGFGGAWDDVILVLRLGGEHGIALPVGEAILAAQLAPAGTEGFGSVTPFAEGMITGGQFTGILKSVPWGRHAGYVIGNLGSQTLLLGKPDSIVQGHNLADEPRDTLSYGNAPVTLLTPQNILELCALLRTGQMAGALNAALAQSVNYVNERQQFGRPLAKFQAVQQSLASFATEAAVVNCAAQGAAQAMQRGAAPFEIGCAKLRAHMAAGLATSTAHQMHGAIGFTQEYALHPFTRRLWSWRSEYGNDQFWAAQVAPA
jgi:acyl-CoA dehydrogenase